MVETPGSVFRLEGLCTGYPATRLSSHSVFQVLIFFYDGIKKGNY